MVEQHSHTEHGHYYAIESVGLAHATLHGFHTLAERGEWLFAKGAQGPRRATLEEIARRRFGDNTVDELAIGGHST